MSKIVLKQTEDGRIFAGHLTKAGDDLRPGSTDVTKQVREMTAGVPPNVERMLEHIKVCAQLWEDAGVSRVRAITRSADDIRQELEGKT